MTDTRDLPFVRELKLGDPPSKREEAWWRFLERIEDLLPGRVLRAWEKLRMVPTNLRWAYERQRYGISVRDTFEFPEHMARVIARGVRHIRSEGHGNPMGIDWDDWQAIMLEIAEGFELIAADNMPRSNVEKAKIERGKTLFTEWFEHLWD